MSLTREPAGSLKSHRFVRTVPPQRWVVIPRMLNCGAPEEIRTPDPQIRSLVLYPAELRARIDTGPVLART